jgi:glycosyltransferase involved in cell wall biosynthesis
MSRPFVTALVDTYNHESFIEEAINSILQQDFPASEMEILVVDDGSTDRTPELVRKFGPRIRLLRKANGGQASAFNAGIIEAQGQIVAFLDGDDWWTSNKVKRVAEVFTSNPEVGITGHSITEILLDGRRRIERLREDTRFQANSNEGARIFRTRKNFLGTSRMTIRTELLKKILPVPVSLVIQADEYLFTMAAALSQVLVLAEPLTFYRHHSANFFQLSAHDPVKLRRKLEVFQALSKVLSEQLQLQKIQPSVRKKIVGTVDLESTQLRLILDGGFPWETVYTELKTMFVLHHDASLWQHLFSCARLLPAVVMPADTYYRWRHQLSRSAFYQTLRRKFLPFPVPRHVERQEKRAP